MADVPFKLTIHMVSSLDGMIAKKDNSISWFETADHYEKGIKPSEQEMWDFLKTIDCYLMGARTYEHALELSKTYGWAYGDTPTIVLTHRDLPIHGSNIEFFSGGLKELVNDRLRTRYKNVWMVGGPSLAKHLLRLHLADEIRLSVLPIILGGGIPFFDHIGKEQPLHLEEVTAYQSGMAELRYQIRK